jgi:hypothetical protein
MLKQDGGIKALLGMVRSGHADVIAQIARGIANFAKCESRVISQGQLNFPFVPQMFHSCFFFCGELLQLQLETFSLVYRTVKC